MSGPRPSDSRCFNENSPRPPVPGEERDVSYKNSFSSSSTSRSSSRYEQPTDQQSSRGCAVSLRSTSCDANSGGSTSAPQGYEPEGRCDRAIIMEDHHLQQQQLQQKLRSSNNANEPLACLQWSRSLHALLEDPKGLKLFEHYLQQEGHIYALYFWFACEGLKEEHDPNKLSAIIKVLVRRFFQRPQLALPDEVRKDLGRRFREGLADRKTFELAQREVERLIEETTYPNFLRSDVYLQYVRQCQQLVNDQSRSPQSQSASVSVKDGQLDNDTNSSTTPPPTETIGCASNLLPTLHEDSELSVQQPSQQQLHLQQIHQQQLHQQQTQQQSRPLPPLPPVPPHEQAEPQQPIHKTHSTDRNVQPTGEMRLTKDMLMATQQFRALDVRPKPEAFAGIYLRQGASPYHATVSRPRVQYSSYNPVSRQDSELQSISSEARTESDKLSVTDASLDSASMSRRNTRKQHIRQYQQIKKSAMINRDSVGHEAIIPRTQRMSREQTKPLDPDTFAKHLIEKLKKIKEDRENEEKLDRKLKEVDLSTSMSDICDSPKTSCAPPTQSSRYLTDDFRDKLQLEDDNDQAILDQHVSRVWNDLTPSLSPKLASPRPRSPDKNRRQLQPQLPPPPPPPRRDQRKEKDVFSTFSGDSGNVNDYAETSELHGAGSMSSLGSHLPKSKSVPSDYAGSLFKQDRYFQDQESSRHRRLESGARSSATKKSMTELTDSGVSVVSDVPPAAVKDTRLLNWLKENDTGSSYCVGKPELKARHKRSANLPQQPFVGDPGMPLLPQPHTATQLEEAKRRLEYEQSRSNSKQRNSSQCLKQQQPQFLDYELVSSMPTAPIVETATSQTTLRRPKQAGKDFTTVVLSFCDEKVPYMLKIAGYNVTLKQFKEVLPKKGNYRYFFKTECEDLDMAVIQEEITEDTELVPLWEGKIMAQVKALE
ncbi:axin isoform X1 [Trichogramma pretiosum]|uniref:axin isoform X1 n=1 Tax=Trichogramma pretiosum TaxID=7493 RepID=UPI0006C9611E|nr:axin isoform X1 [Trichogramma pretiosum]XP_014235309.1 axin isoform X1 [Trichogramma pretiosum]XP_014235310.1 axin isoform X1 [Trichogramma pretiosum]